ncbi:MAG: polysaccharide deacetylase family protein [Ruminococcus sp.]|nr:polysaccharide deacetylase family protein [Ruminococcus sp.]
MSSSTESLYASDDSMTPATENTNEDNSSFSQIKSGNKIGTDKLTGQKILYLTFDDGPSKLTPKILDILDKYNAKATWILNTSDASDD